MKDKPKLLYIGDAVQKTGFARVTHGILDHLKYTWDVTVLGINYNGDPHTYDYPIYPAASLKPGLYDWFGAQRLPGIIDKVKPDILLILQDFWNIAYYLDEVLQQYSTPTVAYIPVDSRNMRQDWVASLNQLDMAIFYTEFGRHEATRHGLTTESQVIPHGVDLHMFHPADKVELRKILGFPEYLYDAYIVGNVGRNAPRKRLDLTVMYFAEWIKRYGIEDAWLLFLCWRDDPDGWNLPQLGLEFGIPEGKMIFWEESPGYGSAKDEYMAYVYSAMDLHVSTTAGEGWGLPQMEAMACGVPNIVPDWSALGEWATSAAYPIQCSVPYASTRHWNTLLAAPDKEPFVEALQLFYTDEEQRKRFSELGLELVANERFRWKNVADRFDKALRYVLEGGQQEEVDTELLAQIESLQKLAAFQGANHVA